MVSQKLASHRGGFPRLEHTSKIAYRKVDITKRQNMSLLASADKEYRVMYCTVHTNVLRFKDRFFFGAAPPPRFMIRDESVLEYLDVFMRSRLETASVAADLDPVTNNIQTKTQTLMTTRDKDFIIYNTTFKKTIFEQFLNR